MLLSVIIPARNEIYLQKTIDNILENIEGDTEIIAVLDGYWADPPIKDHPRVKLIHHSEAIGQRQSINEAMKIARGKFMMKLDAHCAVDKGFDVKLAENCEYDWTVVPRMYNLDIETWEPKHRKRTDYMHIGWNDKDEIRSLYYTGDEYRRQHRKKEMIDDTMTCMGPGWFMHTDRFWELGGCDENHGSWGQQGMEVALKAWLSGGSLKVNKNTWFAHWFRGHIGFPYKLSGRAVKNARDYSKELWLNNNWEKQTRPFSWLLNKFNPPQWKNMDTTIIYYTDNKLEEDIDKLCQRELVKAANGIPIISVSQKPMDLGTNINMGDIGSCWLNIYKQLLAGVEKATTKYIATAEHDCLYTNEHFRWTPPRDDTYYYNENVRFVQWGGNHPELNGMYSSYWHKDRKALSQLICNRELLLKSLRRRVELLDGNEDLTKLLKFAGEPGVTRIKMARKLAKSGSNAHLQNLLKDYLESETSDTFNNKIPNLDIRHGVNFTGPKRGNKRTYEDPYWGDFKKLICKN
jgi:glycosyltransferase involved in cell wall biosynthesis